MRRLGRFVIRRRWAVLAGALVFLVLAGAFGGSVEKRLSAGGFNEERATWTIPPWPRPGVS
ncbi:MAG: hypothetical protein K0R11_705 [Acidimicrobiales bacterium]|nr:hypothetical protein [Acidimicrobiales bacterium]